ncbi:MAG: hypothetical protein Kow0029_19530 [Candidatus Rifleibacteriota bacterium]
MFNMNHQNETGTRQHVLSMLAAIVFFLIIFILIFYGFSLLENRNMILKRQLFANHAIKLLEEGKRSTNFEVFWCNVLSAEFSRARGPESFVKALQKLEKITGQKLRTTIWDKNRQLCFNNQFPEDSEKFKLLGTIGKDLETCFNKGEKNSSNVMKRLRNFFGPLLTAYHLWLPQNYIEPKFLRTYNSRHAPRLWIHSKSSMIAVVYFLYGEMKKNSGKRYFKWKYKDENLKLLFISSRDLRRKSEEKHYLNFLRRIQRNGSFSGFDGKNLIAGKKISANQTLLIVQPYQKIEDSAKASMLLDLIILFSFSIIFKQSGEFLRISNFSIRWQLLIILFTTTGLPLLALSLFATEYLGQKRAALIKEAHQQCINYIQHIDRRSKIINSDLIHRVNKAINDMKPILLKKFPSSKIIRVFRAKTGRSPQDVRLISSGSNILMTEEGYYDGKKIVNFGKANGGRPQKLSVEGKILRDIASYFLSLVNKSGFNYESLTETELIAEMVYQRPMHEFIHDIIRAHNRILPIGWGDKTLPVLLKLISLRKDAIKDFFFLVVFSDISSNSEFVYRHLSNIKRNPHNLKIMVCGARTVLPGNYHTDSIQWFKPLVEKVKYHPSAEPEFISFDGKEWVYAGILSKNLEPYSFFAFYPLERIDRKISDERSFLAGSGLVLLLMLAGLTLVFTSSFVHPLRQLQDGAIAIKKRDFNFRLPPLTKDEFGEIARIFNRSIADFEELSLARIVQSRLLPKGGVETHSFSLYGKSVPMAELGGDYFDYFKADEEHFSILLGDVAGHGVGASLIMAMAKAVIIHCEDKLDNPAEVLTELHKMIYVTRTKTQRKVMTFQYLYFDSQTGKALYSNAGACSPILVDPKKGITTEITLHAPVLGGFKKSKFSNLEVKTEPGQAMVFYTDGIIETSNSEGREIGYDGFQRMLLESFDMNSEIYYQNVYARYLEWLGNGSAQDDLTIIILTHKEKENA